MTEKNTKSFSRTELPGREEVIPIYAKVTIDMMTRIAERRYGWEGGLPSVRQIAEEMNLDPATSAKAFKTLRSAEAVETSKNGRNFRVAGERGIDISRLLMADYFRNEIEDLLVRVRALNSGDKLTKEAKINSYAIPESSAGSAAKLLIPGYNEKVSPMFVAGEDLMVKIANGSYLPGSTLPGTRALMRLYGRSPKEIQEIIALLSAKGAVEAENNENRVAPETEINELRRYLENFYRVDLSYLLKRQSYIENLRARGERALNHR